jgi:prophage regulatory protein
MTATAAQLIRLPEVKRRTGLSRSTIYKREASGQFPRHINVGPRCAAWVASEVDSWISARIADARPETQT